MTFSLHNSGAAFYYMKLLYKLTPDLLEPDRKKQGNLVVKL